MVREALTQIGATHAVNTGDSIVLKPNYVEPHPPETGTTTDPRVIEAVIDWLQMEVGAKDITVAESTWDKKRTDRCFEMVGLPELTRRRRVKLVNLYDDEHVEVDILNALSLRHVLLSRTVLEADCLISLPKLKCHSMAYVTLGIKNLMGAVFPDKALMHRDLDERLRDLATVLRAKLTVIDGLIGSERHETSGSPVQSDVIIAGADPVATDAVGALAMGIDPGGTALHRAEKLRAAWRLPLAANQPHSRPRDPPTRACPCPCRAGRRVARALLHRLAPSPERPSW
jgi:uncharacterized protein (DUF362 family)